ncbi:MAG: hypothetical protein ABI927_04090, partial [Gaiellaceae bacterium]
MTRTPLLTAIAIGATLVVAPSASAMPLGATHAADAVSTPRAATHIPKPRCIHNGISTNTAGHVNCRANKTGATTTDTATTTSTSDQGTTGSDQGDQGTTGSDQGDQGTSGSDQGDQ